MEKHKKTILWMVILSEGSHIFCCGLPTLFSVFSLLAGAGIITTMPGVLQQAHDLIHLYEIPMIIASGVVLALGWGLHYYSEKINCRDTGCHHGPCEPKKDRVKVFLVLATVLFAVNVSVYTVFHRGMQAAVSAEHHEGHDH